jgi:HAE1 family hydrophobic/amphiphilic exporter-1
MRAKRYIVFGIWVSVGMGVLPPLAGREIRAQQPAASERTDAQEPVSLGRVRPLKVKRVGVDVENLWYLSLHEAILKALENNTEIQVQRTAVQASEFALRAAQGAYDPVVSIGAPPPAVAMAAAGFSGGTAAHGLGIESRATPAASRLLAGRDDTAQRSRTFTYNVGMSQLLPTGGSWQLTFSNQRTTTNSLFATLNPQFFTTLALDVVQPLWRDFRWNQTAQQIRIAKKALDLSDSQFRQRVIEIIAQVQRAYYDLVFAIRNVEILQEAVELARRQHEENQQRVEAGTLPPIELHQSLAEIERRNQELIAAIAQVTVAENALKGLILPTPDDPLWRANIVPTESIEYVPLALDEESAVRVALAHRPEVKQVQLQKEQTDITIRYLANQTRPAISLLARYASFGLAGTEVPPSPEFPFLAGGVAAQFLGGTGQAIENALRQRFRNVAIGVSLSFPLRNHAAQARLGQAKAQARALDFQQEQLRQRIVIEVRNALQNVEAARQSIEAARAARLAREKQLEGEQERFAAGMSTNFLVLQYQNQLSQARGMELQALIAYNKAIAELQRVMGTTLDVYNIRLSPDSR